MKRDIDETVRPSCRTSEPVRLGDILPAVMRDIEKRMRNSDRPLADTRRPVSATCSKESTIKEDQPKDRYFGADKRPAEGFKNLLHSLRV